MFDGDRAPRTGAEVRDYHVNIKGVDAKGRRYHALNPDVFYWAHSTFFVGTLIVAERFCGGLTEAEKRRTVRRAHPWYWMYGMSMRPVPETWEDFQAYWDHMCRNVLEDNKAARDVLDLGELPKPPFAQWIPDRLWTQHQRHVVAPVMMWLTVGLYDPAVRELLGYTVVGPRRVAAPPVLRRRADRVLAAAQAGPHASARPRRLGSRHRADRGRHAAAADAGAKPATARGAWQPDALLPEGLSQRTAV